MSNGHQIDIKHSHQRIGQKCKSNRCQNLALNLALKLAFDQFLMTIFDVNCMSI